MRAARTLPKLFIQLMNMFYPYRWAFRGSKRSKTAETVVSVSSPATLPNTDLSTCSRLKWRGDRDGKQAPRLPAFASTFTTLSQLIEPLRQRQLKPRRRHKRTRGQSRIGRQHRLLAVGLATQKVRDRPSRASDRELLRQPRRAVSHPERDGRRRSRLSPNRPVRSRNSCFRRIRHASRPFRSDGCSYE